MGAAVGADVGTAVGAEVVAANKSPGKKNN